MDNLGVILPYLYPDASPISDWEVTYKSKKGRAFAIVKWNEEKLGPQPTEEFLASKEAEAVAAVKAKKDKKVKDKEDLAALTPAQIDAAGPDKLKEILKTMLANMRSN